MSNLKFGTSGIRGLASDFTHSECHAFVTAFMEAVRVRGFKEVVVAGDLRESTPDIFQKAVSSLCSSGYSVLNGGLVPTPALAWGCATLGVPGIMITGSHIPSDRNGLKFYLPEGEILKADEENIVANYQRLEGLEVPHSIPGRQLKDVDLASLFSARYLNAFGSSLLGGFRVGFYSHSSVARDLFPSVLRQMGADVFEFGRSEVFIPVDTEAVESVGYLHQTLVEHGLDVVVSTDGDADRPLVICEDGRVVPGEILGLIAAKFLGAETIVYPVSCSSALRDSRWIDEVCITKIGSPFVLGKMLDRLQEDPYRKVVGFEANGGFLLGSQLSGLKPLLTRDSLLPVLAFLLSMSKEKVETASQLLAPFERVVNLSGLIKNYALERSVRALALYRDRLHIGGVFESFPELGTLVSVNDLDGVRANFDSGITVHLRPSGNAPEFRLYIEAPDQPTAGRVLSFFEDWLRAL